jgi:hypothetical protein
VTFLEIARRVANKAGIAGTTPATTINQAGEALRVVNWTQDAYIEVQDIVDDWWFMQKEFSFDCTIGVSKYPKSTVADLANWKKNDVRCYLSTTDDEQWLRYCEWEDFRAVRLMGSSRTVTGRPQDFTLTPDKQLQVWPIPDAAYTLNGEYFKKSEVFASDNETPIFSRHHMIIVYKALEYYGAYSSDPSIYADAQKNFERLYDKLAFDESSKLMSGGSLC